MAARHSVWTYLLLFVLAICPCTFLAQTTVGIQPYGSYQGTIDQINVNDLGIHIEIPIYQHRGRGNGMGVNARLIYDSGGTLVSVPPHGLAVQLAGWRLIYGSAPPGTISGSTNPVGVKGQPGCEWVATFSFTDSTGYSHMFEPMDAGSCASPGTTTTPPWTGTAAALDGSGYVISVNSPTVTVSTPSGLQYVPSSTAVTTTDANGNTGQSSTIYHSLADDSGTAISISTNYPSGSYTTTVQYVDSNGQNQSIIIKFTEYQFSYNCPDGPTTTPYDLVSSVAYPDGSSYQFGYGPTGAITSITLPTGGAIQYQGTLGVEQTCNLSELPTKVTRTTSDGQVSYTRTISPPTSTTQITTPNGGQIVSFILSKASYVTINGKQITSIWPLSLETSHSWTDPSGATLKSTMRCYNGASGNCTTTAVNPAHHLNLHHHDRRQRSVQQTDPVLQRRRLADQA